MSALRALVLAAVLCGGTIAAGHASADSLRLCDRGASLTARQQDRLLSFAAIVRRELDGTGQQVALIARSGLDLQRFGLRYSHAGVSLRAGADVSWSVRQLYYACDEGLPRLYDQGLAGFVLGNDDPALGYVSIVLLPREAAAQLERAALDNARALRLLAATYSANAYPFSVRYQNCNQWVMELLAAAWGGLDDAQDLRERAQAWLVDRGYAPEPVEVGSPLLMFAGGFVPWIRFDDHPDEDLRELRFRVSLPASIETFVRDHAPGAQRIELCHDERQVVVRHGWQPLADGCRAADGDRVVALE